MLTYKPNLTLCDGIIFKRSRLCGVLPCVIQRGIGRFCKISSLQRQFLRSLLRELGTRSGTRLCLFSNLSLTLNKANLNIYPDDQIKDVIVGSLLGDGDIEKRGRQLNGRFKITQSSKNKEYINCVFEFFFFYCSTPLRLYTYQDKRTNIDYSSLTFRTNCLPLFTEYYELFYFNSTGFSTLNYAGWIFS